MSVWPSSTPSPVLHGSEGELVSVSVTVEPRDLEDLLEALATLDFSINPGIYHDAVVVSTDDGGVERTEPATVVEFPAYAPDLPKIRAALEACSFNSDVISVSAMLDAIQSGERIAHGPPGVGFVQRVVRKPAAAASAGRQ
jgi:hypothetical protein